MSPLSYLSLGTFLAGALFGQGLDPSLLQKAPTDTWPTYNGDYSGRRYTTLSQISNANVQNLTLAWVYRANSAGGNLFGSALKSTLLEVDGALYFPVPD